MEIEEGCPDLWGFFQKFECLVNTWAIVGCFYFNWKRTFGDEVVKYIHYSEAQAFRRACLLKIPELRAKFTEHSILKYFQKVYQEFMTGAIELVRSRGKVPFWACSRDRLAI